jgi:hypothetical protein
MLRLLLQHERRSADCGELVRQLQLIDIAGLHRPCGFAWLGAVHVGDFEGIFRRLSPVSGRPSVNSLPFQGLRHK